MKVQTNFLSEKERSEILSLNFTKSEIISNFTLTLDEVIDIKKFNKTSTQIGFAIQLLFLRNLGRKIPLDISAIPVEILNYLAEQLEIKYFNIKSYIEAETSRKKHFRDITEKLNYSKYEINQNILDIADDVTMNLAKNKEMAIEFLKRLKCNKIIVPGISYVEKILSESLKKTENKIYENILNQLPSDNNLKSLLELDSKNESFYTTLRSTNVNISSNGARELLSKIKLIDTLNGNINFSFLSDEKLQYFNFEIQKSNRARILRFSNEKKRLSYLAFFVYFRKRAFVDMVIEVTSSYAHKVLKRSQKKSQKNNVMNLKNYQNNSILLKSIVCDIIKIEEFEEFKTFKRAILSIKEKLDSQKDEMEEIDFLLKAHQSFNYTNELLEAINFDSNTKPKFIKLLNSFKEFKNKKKLEIEDISFFSNQWQKYIKKYNFSKKIIELAVLYATRDNIRSGDVFVRDSRKYNSFDHYLVEIPKVNNDEGNKFLNTLKELLHLPKSLEFNLDFEKDERNTFNEKVYGYFPKITMTEIIYEVNSWTNFLEDFRESNKNINPEKQRSVIATLLANGHNIGFSKMAVSSSIDEEILRRVNEYYFNYNTLSRAQRTLVNYHNSLDIAKNWGDGERSSSDGMRVPINSKTIYADYNAHYKNRGGAIYRHISDQYTPFYVQMLEGRDSNHVLDGLLYHDTNLNIYEHSTDTAGYTEQMFALTHLLGFKFKPRIKNSEQQQLYYFENTIVDDFKFKKINEKLILENYQEIMRLVESIKIGKVKASLILQKLSSYARDNSVAKGLKEIGRVIKTIYLLEYFSDKRLRKEVQKILNKGESINSVARIIHFGRYGRMAEGSIEEQLEKASSLNILLSVLIIWNSRYLEKVCRRIEKEEWFNEEEFKRISPLGTGHINFLGKYIFEDEKIVSEDGLRPLKK